MAELLEHEEAKPRDESIEERCFAACLVCFHGHFNDAPAMGPKTAAKTSSMAAQTVVKTQNSKDVRFGSPLSTHHAGSDNFAARSCHTTSPYGCG